MDRRVALFRFSHWFHSFSKHHPSGPVRMASCLTSASPLLSWVSCLFRCSYPLTNPIRYTSKQQKLTIQRKIRRLMNAPPSLVSTEEAERLLEDGLAFQGQLRVLSPSLAFVEHPMDKKRVMIFGHNRSQALNGDMVVVRLHPMGQWKVSGTGISYQTDKRTTTVPASPSTPEFSEMDTAVSDAVTTDETSDAEFSEVPSLTGTAQPPSPEDFYRLPSKYHDLFSYRTLDDLTFDPHSSWPIDLPWNLNLSAPPMVWTPLPSQSLIRTGHVVSIFQKNPRSRRLVGQLAFFRPRIGRITRKTPPLPADAPTDDAICLFVPNSTNHALVKLDPSSIPRAILENRALGSRTNYVCAITGWNSRMQLPSGVLCEQLGDMNELEPATQQILLEFGLEDKEFRPEHLRGLPEQPDSFIIPAIEYVQRRDFRSCCIMTIDPPSAKDIDDALHVNKIENDLFEVGIHIADVSYFVKPGTPLDQEAAKRTTSIYLVQRVIPMLPPILSEHLCSLNPRVDRLAFSVVLTVRESGEIINSWFGRSIIRSRAKLSYDQALALLKASEDQLEGGKLQAVRQLVPEPESPFSYDQMQDSLVWLNRIARNLRKKRLENGALTLQKAKIEFDLHSTMFDKTPEPPCGDSQPDDLSPTSTVAKRTIWPRGYSIETPGPANQLIEEWMLAANQAVARRLFDEFWERRLKRELSVRRTVKRTFLNESKWPGVLLRRHDAPAPANMTQLVSLLREGGIVLEEETSKGLSAALEKHNVHLKEEGYSDAECSALLDALSHLIYVRMKMATYFSLDDLLLSKFQSSQLDADTDSVRQQIFNATWHFGLSVPLYTHFTSPIRRYADLLVHRQLGAILDGEHLTSVSSKSELIHQLRRFNYKIFSSSRGRQLTDTRNEHTTVPFRLSLHAAWCNHQRMMSRRAQEASQRLFLTACLRDCGALEMYATVIDLSSSSIKLSLPGIGIIINARLKHFLKNVTNWELVSEKTRGTIKKGHPGTQLRIEWTPTEPIDESSLVEAKLSEPKLNNTTKLSPCVLDVSVLSVIPCRVYCEPDRLNLHAEFLTSAPVESAVPCQTTSHPETSPQITNR